MRVARARLESSSTDKGSAGDIEDPMADHRNCADEREQRRDIDESD